MRQHEQISIRLQEERERLVIQRQEELERRKIMEAERKDTWTGLHSVGSLPIAC